MKHETDLIGSSDPTTTSETEASSLSGVGAVADPKSALNGIKAALDLMGEVEDRMIHARFMGKRARLSITAHEWATLRDTLITARNELEPPRE